MRRWAPLAGLFVVLAPIHFDRSARPARKTTWNVETFGQRRSVIVARPDGWIEIDSPTDDRESHIPREESGLPSARELITPDQAIRWVAVASQLLERSLRPNPEFWGSSPNPLVSSPSLGVFRHGHAYGLWWSRSDDGRANLYASLEDCGGKAGYSVGATVGAVRRLFAVLDSAAKAARAFQSVPTPIDSIRPFATAGVSCQAKLLEAPLPRELAASDADLLAVFAIDRMGRVEPSTVRFSPRPSESVEDVLRRAMAGWRFEPARVAGIAVGQWFHLPLHPMASPPLDETELSFTPTPDGWVVYQHRDRRATDRPSSLGERTLERQRFAPWAVKRWLDSLPAFFAAKDTTRPPEYQHTRYSRALGGGDGIRLRVLASRLRPDSIVYSLTAWHADAVTRECGGQSIGDRAAIDRSLTRLAQAAESATRLRAVPAFDSASVYSAFDVDCVAAPSDSNVAIVGARAADPAHDEVVVDFVVDRYGDVIDSTIGVLSQSPPNVALSAARLVSNWEFRPALVDSRPVSQRAHAVLKIVPPDRAPRNPYPIPRAAVAATKNGCLQTGGPRPSDLGEETYRLDETTEGIEFRCRIHPNQGEFRVAIVDRWTKLRVLADTGLIQTLEFGEAETPYRGMDQFVSAVDLDGDGFRDLRLLANTGRGYSNSWIWRYAPSSGRFVSDEQLSELSNVSPIAGRPCVTSSMFGTDGSTTQIYCRGSTGWVLTAEETQAADSCVVRRRDLVQDRWVTSTRRARPGSC